MSYYSIKYAFFYYKRHRIYINYGVPLSFIDYAHNIKSLGVTTLTIYCTNQIPDKYINQWSYPNDAIPDKNVYFIPFNWITQDAVYTANSGLTRTATNTVAQLYSIRTKIVSTLIESVPSEAYTGVMPATLIDTNGKVYGPKYESDSQPLIENAYLNQIKIKENLDYDYILFYPSIEENTFFYLWVKNKVSPFYPNSYNFTAIDFRRLYYGIELPRIHQSLDEIHYLESDTCFSFFKSVDKTSVWENEAATGGLNNLFLAKKPIIGNTPQVSNNNLEVYDIVNKSEIIKGQIKFDETREHYEIVGGTKYYYVQRREWCQEPASLEYYPNSSSYYKGFLADLGGNAIVYTRVSGKPYYVLGSGDGDENKIFGDILIIEWDQEPLGPFFIAPSRTLNSYTSVHESDYCAQPVRNSISLSNEEFKQAFATLPGCPSTSGFYIVDHGNFAIMKSINYTQLNWTDKSWAQNERASEGLDSTFNYEVSIIGALNYQAIRSSQYMRVHKLDTEPLKFGVRQPLATINKLEIDSFLFGVTKSVIIEINRNGGGEFTPYELDPGWLKFTKPYSMPLDIIQGRYTSFTAELVNGTANWEYGAEEDERFCLALSFGKTWRNRVVPSYISNKASEYQFRNGLNSLQGYFYILATNDIVSNRIDPNIPFYIQINFL